VLAGTLAPSRESAPASPRSAWRDGVREVRFSVSNFFDGARARRADTPLGAQLVWRTHERLLGDGVNRSADMLVELYSRYESPPQREARERRLGALARALDDAAAATGGAGPHPGIEAARMEVEGNHVPEVYGRERWRSGTDYWLWRASPPAGATSEADPNEAPVRWQPPKKAKKKKKSGVDLVPSVEQLASFVERHARARAVDMELVRARLAQIEVEEAEAAARANENGADPHGGPGRDEL
jgi:hypothetical protein